MLKKIWSIWSYMEQEKKGWKADTLQVDPAKRSFKRNHENWREKQAADSQERSPLTDCICCFIQSLISVTGYVKNVFFLR